MNLQVTITDAIWQPVLDQANAEAKRAHDQQQLTKPEAERTVFTPMTLQNYAKARVADIERSYKAQQDHVAGQKLLADPEILAAASTPAGLAKLKAAAKTP